MNSYEKLLLENKLWAERMREADPGFFARLTGEEDPEFLWIGSSDSRVHPNEVTSSHPGEMTIHKNFGNLVHPDDPSLDALLRHAVEDLNVQHIIVCGHTRCAAAKLALDGSTDPWLTSLTELAQSMKARLDELSSVEALTTLVVANVEAQVRNLSAHPVVKAARQRGPGPRLHGWLFVVETGRIKDLVVDDGPPAAL